MSYVANTASEQKSMLETIGASSVDGLFSPIPESLRLRRDLAIPGPFAEQDLTRVMGRMASNNRSVDDLVCFLGGGAYDHFIPAAVDTLSMRSEFYTAYTPYQAEASQGSLQAFYEFQTLICQLTGMDVANASLYDGASAAAEAVLMAMSVTGRQGKIVVAETLHPHARQAIATILANLGPRIETVPCPGGFLNPTEAELALDDNTACLVVQNPNFLGGLEEMAELAQKAHAKGVLLVASVDPISLGLLKKPGDYGADIVIAEGQGLGNPLAYGGPYLGLMACREEFVRKIPGRLIGQTVDRNGKKCFVLTLQTREQHIRREKATSNICTNQGLYALRAAIHLSLLGPQGLKETAISCTQKAHYHANKLLATGLVHLEPDRAFFKEFTIKLEASVARKWTPREIVDRMLDEGYLAGYPTGNWLVGKGDCLTIAVTEKRTKEEMDQFVEAFARVATH